MGNAMGHKHKQRIAPREPTPAPGGTPTTHAGGGLPDDMLNEQVQRLALFSLLGVVLWTTGLAMDYVLQLTTPTVYSLVQTWKFRVVEVVGIITSGLTFLYLKYARHSPYVKTNASLGYMLLCAALIAAMNTWISPPPLKGQIIQVSWVAILVLVYSMIAPVSPGRMLAVSLVAASMDPLGVWFAHLRGVPVPSPLQTFVLFWPNYACAGLSVVPSRLMRHFGRKLSKARDMGSYELLELLGHGGMGEVWEAQHRLLARRAAVKLVRPELLGAASDAEARLVIKRFEREAQATAALSSPHTINLFDYGVTDQGVFYYVMELLMGRDLESLVRTFGPLPAERTAYLLRQVCHSLADAHARGLVHRDIKPANIYVCRMGLEYDFVKVLDFGLVKVNSDRAQLGQTLLTAEQKTTGTPAYMAPEIILGEATVDRRADVYALGCVAYYLLTGQLVFEADTPMKMLLQHVQAEPIPPSQRTELPIPHDLEALVLACLQKDPNKRPQNAEMLLGMACNCKSGDRWTSESAKAWWRTHLPEFTRPLSLGESVSDGAGRAVMLQ
ncbi:MAG TPA: serine/threonine-protein kinase [Vicinamibacterales bacterium]|nr:serine/threonine-protein kinase [Vicinamibacterales bacterium]